MWAAAGGTAVIEACPCFHSCRWALDYPEYNEYVRENAEKLINKPAPGVS